MGLQVCLSVLVSFLLIFCVCALGLVEGQKGYNICDVHGCNCSLKAGKWLNINCVLDNEQELRLEQGHIPKEAFEIFILGGKSITFSTKTFSFLPALSILYMENVKEIIMEKKSFYEINSSSFLFKINGCDKVLIKSNAFDDMQSSLTTEITRTLHVILEESPFTKLYNSTFKDIGTLNLAPRAFEVKHQGVTQNHGPAIVVIFNNVKIPVIRNATFLTSLAQLTFENCQIGDIEPQSISANEISALSFVNSTVKVIRREAFAERTLVLDFRISKCYVMKIESGASRAAIKELSVKHSNITTIESRAIVSTVATLQIIANQIANFQPSSIVLHNWNIILIEDNFIKELHKDFINPQLHDEAKRFTFKSNVIYEPKEDSLQFILKLSQHNGVLTVFNDNLFEHFCHCNMSSWIDTLILSNLTNTNINDLTNIVMSTSYCRVNDFLSTCFSLPVGLISMKNFTDNILCKNNTICTLSIDDSDKVNTAILNNTFFTNVEDEDSSSKQSWLIFIIVIVGAFILALIATFIALLIRGSRWLKRKGYFRNIHYSHNNAQRNNSGNDTDEENTIVTMDENEKLEVPEELTLEFLQVLSQRLDDPTTHQEASEMIERLYEMFVVDETNYDNNNRHLEEEEAHLYEELGNLNLQIPPPPYEEKPPTQNTTTTNPRGILKLMENKVNSTTNTNANDSSTSCHSNESNSDVMLPQLVNEYSEPNDVAVHFYSELKQSLGLEGKNGSVGNLGDFSNSSGGTKDSLKSNKSGSGKMALRPLPSKPASIFDAGPSKLL